MKQWIKDFLLPNFAIAFAPITILIIIIIPQKYKFISSIIWSSQFIIQGLIYFIKKKIILKWYLSNKEKIIYGLIWMIIGVLRILKIVYVI